MPATTATPYAPAIPRHATTAAPMNGPAKSPIRWTPPSVERARARIETGTISVR